MADLEALGEEYLVTVEGGTPTDACGLFCGEGDIDAWTEVVHRISEAIKAIAKANNVEDFSKPLMTRTIKWLFHVRQYQGAHFWQAFSGSNEVERLVWVARAGVQVLYELQVEAEEAGGKVPSPGPSPAPRPDRDLFPGPDELWYIGGGIVLALVLLQMWKSR